MKKIVFALALTTCAYAFAAPAAKPVDPLWAKTVAQAAVLKKWIPEDIDMDIEVRDGSEVTKKKSTSHLAGWDKGTPRYVVKDLESSKLGKSKDGSFNIDGFTTMSDELMTDDAPVKRSDNQLLRGKKMTLFQLTDSKTGVKIDSKLWVEPESGVLQQTDTVINVPLLADIVMSTVYAKHEAIGIAPKVADINVDLRIPFKSGQFHMINTPKNWIKRP